MLKATKNTCKWYLLTYWSSLPDYLRDPTRYVDSFRSDLITLLFSFYMY